MQKPARGRKQVHTSPAMQNATQEADTSAHSPARDTEGGPQELRQVHRTCETQRVSSRGWEAHTSLCDTEGTGKDPHKPLLSKLAPEAQGRTGEQKHWQ